MINLKLLMTYLPISIRQRLFCSSTWVIVTLILCGATGLYAQTIPNWSIPAGGNSYLIKQDGGKDRKSWLSPSDATLFFFHTSSSCEASLALKLSVETGTSQLGIKIGERDFTMEVKGKEPHLEKLGRMKLDSGYTKIEIRGLQKEGVVFAEISSLELTSNTPGLVLSFVKDNVDNRFYWGRRGPSVHLNYELPEGAEVEYFYNELTVPVGQDPIGSYFMANGFGEGYFGIQVNGPVERRILFSVWSPYRTDKPGEIPESDRIVLLSKGEGVHTGEFGNEGSGGQSYLKYPWKAGITYRFLLKGRPDGAGSTIYTAWFNDPEAGNWQLIASFKRPKTDHFLTRLHSFLENFSDTNGYLGRKCHYTNAWCLDKDGRWFPLTKARFTGDDIAKRGYRLDYAGGTEGNSFYLQNGGFFNNSGCKLQSSHQLPK
jgi:hypothetical protein